MATATTQTADLASDQILTALDRGRTSAAETALAELERLDSDAAADVTTLAVLAGTPLVARIHDLWCDERRLDGNACECFSIAF